jgi:peptidoglycan-associated lipoprotein
MKPSLPFRFWLIVPLVCLIAAGGCAKKKVAANAPAAAQPESPAPTAEFTANPTSIHPGESVELTWTTTNATEVELEGIAPVEATGTYKVTPETSRTYKLIVKGPGGQKDATVEVTVAPPASEPSAPRPEGSTSSISAQPIFFDYDKYNIRADQLGTLIADADFLRDHAELRILLEGYADERGSTEYNLALGDSRANAVRLGLVRAGVNAERIQIVSYGKERPLCTESSESCWRQNRRAHFVLTQD